MAMAYFHRREYYTETPVLFLLLGESQDFDWHVNAFANFTDVKVLTPAEAAEDMALLSMCDGLILSTGTFGWWAAYLNRGPIVVSFTFWKKGAYAAGVPKALFPKHWIVL